MSFFLHPSLGRHKPVSERTLRQDRHRDLAIRVVRPFRRGRVVGSSSTVTSFEQHPGHQPGQPQG